MSRHARSLLLVSVLTILVSITACGRGNDNGIEFAADRPWEALPENVVFIGHVDLQSLFDSDLARSMEGKLPALPMDAAQTFQQFVEATGFDYRSDLDSITLGAGYTGSDDDAPFYAIVTGRFDQQKIEDYAEGRSEVTRGTHAGLTTFATRSPTGNPAQDTTLALLDAGTLIMATSLDFEALAGAVKGEGRTAAGSDLAKLVSESAGQVRFAVNVPAEVRDAPTPTDGGAAMFAAAIEPLRQVEQALITVDVSSDLDLTVAAQATSEEASQEIHEAVNGFLQMIKMFAANDPDAAEVLNALELSRDGKRVELSLVVSNDQIVAALEKAGPSMAMMGGGAPSIEASPTPSPVFVEDSGFEPPRRSDRHEIAAASDPLAAGMLHEPEQAGLTPGQYIADSDYASLVGRLVTVTSDDGQEMTATLTAAGDTELTFSRNVSGGEFGFSIPRATVTSMVLNE